MATESSGSVTLRNREIAEALEEIGELLAIEGENPFRVRAYENAARTLRALPQPVAELVERGEDLSRLRGIGEALARKIEELVRSGHLEYLERLERRVGVDARDLLSIPGLGPKRLRTLRDLLGVRTREDLRRACEAGRVRDLPGFGAATERKLCGALAEGLDVTRRWPRAELVPIARSLVEHLSACQGTHHVVVAGSYRRKRDTVGDLDLLVTARKGTAVTERLVNYGEVTETLSRGPTRATVMLAGGLLVDLRVVKEASYGAALAYFTGSRAHQLRLRRMAQERGWKLNEYGLFAGTRKLAGASEASLYKRFDMPVIPPELREDRGEIEAALAGELPHLITPSDLRGDLHVHTNASDGRESLEVMVAAAKALGREYVAITDHTGGLGVAHGLGRERMRAHLDAIEALDQRTEGLRVLKGAEVDIRRDGTLDLDEDLLEELDVVLVSMHSQLRLPREEQTARLLHALSHPRAQILAHPSGRLLGRRPPMALDMERVLDAAADHGVALEINSQPLRLDLDDTWARAARERGIPLVISSDAHGTEQLEGLTLGVDQARRGWVRAEDVLNTRSCRAFLARLR